MKKRGMPKQKTGLNGARTQRLVCCLNDKEMGIISDFLKKRKVGNKGRWMRETLLGSIYRDMNENYPTLFDEFEMRQ